jgi:hypothetical protein
MFFAWSSTAPDWHTHPGGDGLNIPRSGETVSLDLRHDLWLFRSESYNERTARIAKSAEKK